jgi:DNA invertase Pin-like site-specific DNA recombinase
MDTLKNYAYNDLSDLLALAQQELRFAVKTVEKILAYVLAFSYLRFSDPVQANGDSVRRQTDLRNAWLKKHPEVRLDTSLRMEDRGVSGYRGEHRLNKKHALAQFLDLVERGRVPVGSYLIVENLDRLTRENPVVSIPAVLGLIAAGIRIVQLEPVELVYDSNMDQMHLMNMLWELARGHGESKRKSGLCGEAWMNKKEQASADRTPYGAMCPAWLELVGVKKKGNKKDFSAASYRVKADAAAAVKKVFEWCAAGLGTFGILDRLNREGVPPIGRSGAWHRSYLQKLLDYEAVLGIYQPHKGSRGPGRVAQGEPIANFYPAIIDEALWDRAHKAIASRQRTTSGRPATVSKNPFSGLLFDALDGQKLHVSGTHGAEYKYLVSAAAIQKKKGAQWRAFPLETFQDGILSQLQELKASDLFSDPGAGKAKEIGDRLREVEKRLTVALAKFEADPESPTWADRVSQYDREKRALVKELAEARLEAAHPLSGSWEEAVALMAENEPVRLRAALLATVERIWCVFVGKGKLRIAAAQVAFKSGARRDYLLVHQGALGGAVGTRPAQRWGDSLAEAGIGNADLGDCAKAWALAEILAEEFDVKEFTTEARRF